MGDYVGFIADDYSTVSGYSGFNDFGFDTVEIEGNTYYILTSGDSLDFMEFLEDNDSAVEILYFSYLYSTWSINGF